MPTRELRSEAGEWKKRSLGSLRELISALKGTKKDVDRILSGTKGAVAQVCREASKIAKGYEGALDEDDDDYETGSDAMDALRELPSADEEAEDARTQASDTLDALIAHLESIKDAVSEVNP